jgi:hypothetical protein
MRVGVYVEPRDRKDLVTDVLDALEGKAEIDVIVSAKDAEKYRCLRAFGFEESSRDIVRLHRAAR